MKVEIDESAGFCWGIQRTVEVAEKFVYRNPNKKVYILGELVFNTREIKRLENLGINTIQADNLSLIDSENSIIILRAHGEPPETYDMLRKFDVKFTDTTCSIVASQQEVVAKYFNKGYNIIIYGEENHPEVIGLLGNCDNNGYIISNIEEANAYRSYTDKNLLIAQTSVPKSQFESIRRIMSISIPNLESYYQDHFMLEIKDATCKFNSKRESDLVKFVESYDLVLFLADRKSSNGKMLFELCRAVNSNTVFIEDKNEIKKEYFINRTDIGITGAMNTPRWLLAEAKEKVLELLESEVK
jgi:4-hydroxy-3-methylbut-2-en-1-yl diphosphate reductase